MHAWQGGRGRCDAGGCLTGGRGGKRDRLCSRSRLLAYELFAVLLGYSAAVARLYGVLAGVDSGGYAKAEHGNNG